MAKVTKQISQPLSATPQRVKEESFFFHPLLQRSKLPSFFILLLLLPLVFYTLSLLRLMTATVSYPWELDQGEGHNVWSAWLLLHGRGPYLSLNDYPFFNINYPPLHFVLLAPLVALLGPSLAVGRLLSDLCVFGLTAAVGAIVWRYSRNRIATALAVLLILANPYLYIFGTLATVNVSQVMFGTWGLYFLGRALERVGPDGSVRAAERINRPALLIGLALLLAALYTKQQAIDAVAAGFLFLLWRRPWLALVCGLAFGAVGGSLFLLLDWLTAHQFYVNLVKLNLNDFIPRQLLDQGRAYALTHAPILLLAGVYALLTGLSKQRLSLCLLYLLTTGLSSLTVGKVGAAETYFYSSIAAVAIAASLLVAKALSLKTNPQPSAPDPNRLSSGLRFLLFLLVPLLLAQTVLFYHTPETPHPWKDLVKGHSGNYVLFGGLPGETERAAGQRLADRIKAASPPVLTEEASFAMVNGYEVVTNPSNILVFNQARLWQGQKLEAMVQNRCFSLMLLHGYFLPDFIQAAMQANYRKAQVERLNGGEYVLWERLPQSTQAQEFCQKLSSH